MQCNHCVPSTFHNCVDDTCVFVRVCSFNQSILAFCFSLFLFQIFVKSSANNHGPLHLSFSPCIFSLQRNKSTVCILYIQPRQTAPIHLNMHNNLLSNNSDGSRSDDGNTTAMIHPTEASAEQQLYLLI